MRELTGWLLGKAVTLFKAERGERVVGACNVRGVLYVVTTDRVLRYDPERDEVSTEVHTR